MLTRYEAAVTTGQWYALTRLESDFDKVLAEIATRYGIVAASKPNPKGRCRSA